jgi:GNAT superfamily N-acetyltransferase
MTTGNAPGALGDTKTPQSVSYSAGTIVPVPPTRQAERVRLREWDPGTAPEAEIQSWLRAYNRSLVVDMPTDPQWSDASLREYLSVTMPRERRHSWIVNGDDASLVGYASLLLLGDLGVFELFVDPAVRRQGVGRRLLAIAARRALDEGFSDIGVEVIGGTAAAAFYQRHGFHHAYTEMRALLDLSAMDWRHLGDMASGVVHGYRIEFHPGDLPDEVLPAYAEAKEVRRLDPPGDLSLRPSSYDPQRLRDSLRCLQERGLKPYIVFAVHEPTGRIAGLTELVVPAQHPTRADQYDTVVSPAHGGYGLGRALKARMLLELRAAEPQLRDVQTWQATDNEQLLGVNEELGFKPDREWREYEADAAELSKLLRDTDP